MKMRKLFAGIAAAATLLGGMALGATSAQAGDAATTAGTAAITVTNSQEGHTYKAYKFATLKVDTDNKGKSVQVDTDPAWVTAVKTAVDTANGVQKPVQTTPAEYAGNPAAYAAMKTADADEAWFRAFAEAMVAPQGNEANGQVNGNGKDAQIGNLTEGWYLVTDTYMKNDRQTTGVNAIVATTLNGLAGNFSVVGYKGTGQGTIKAVGKFVAKNENTPTIDSKTVASADPNVSFDKKTVKIGQQLTYTVKAIVPETADGYDSYPYYIQDVASKGLTIDKDSIKVMAGNEAADGYTITSTVSQTTGETTTTITFANAKKYAGKQLVVTYNATVNDQILDDAKVTNTAKASHDGTFDGTGVTKTLYTGNLEFLKYGVGNDENKLAGATFNVYAGAKVEGTPLKFTSTKTGANGVYKFNAEGFTNVISGDDGKIVLNGLAAGKYTFKETGFVAGYAKNIVPEFTIEVAISDNGVVTYKLTEENNNLGLASIAVVDKVNTIKVKNVKNVTQLPLTGAAGTTLFTVVALLVAGAGVAVALKSRQRMH